MSGTNRAAVVCGVDVGTTNVKVVAIAQSGHVVGRARRPTPRNPVDLSIDAGLLLDVLEDMILEACADEYVVHAVATAGIGEDGVLVDDAIAPLGQALAWFDPRRGRLFQALEPSLVPAPGLGVVTDSSRSLVGWLWATAQPGCERAVSWVAITDYAAASWAGTAFMSDTLAARTSAWVPETRQWISDRVSATLRDESLLPPVVRTGDIVGGLRSGRLEEAGALAPGAVVVAGGHDHPIGGWGVDLMHPGAILDSMGTAEVVVAQTARTGALPRASLDIGPGIRSDGLTLLKVEELARNVDWVSQDPAVAAAVRRIVQGDEAPDRYLSSDAFVPGTTGGGRPAYAESAPRSAHSRASSVVGALARLGGDAIDAVAAAMPAASRVYAAGGWARSPGWMEAKRTLTGRDIEIMREPEITAVGAALLAATALDWPISARTALSGEPARA